MKIIKNIFKHFFKSEYEKELIEFRSRMSRVLHPIHLVSTEDLDLQKMFSNCTRVTDMHKKNYQQLK